MRRLAAALLVTLGACQPQGPDGAPAPPPADAPKAAVLAPKTELPADFAGDFEAVGTEPFWNLTLRDGQAKLTRPDHPEMTGPLGTGAIEGGKAVWTFSTGAETMTVRLWKATCSDGMSDRQFPLTAQVEVPGATLNGCAARAGETPPAR